MKYSEPWINVQLLLIIPILFSSHLSALSNDDKTEMRDRAHILLALFIPKPTLFLEEFFQNILSLDYPKSCIDLFLYNAEFYHNKEVRAFMQNIKVNEYKSSTVIFPRDGVKEKQARDLAIAKCVEVKCDYFFSVDSEAQLNETRTIEKLINEDKPVIAPLLKRPYSTYSNLIGELETPDYIRWVDEYISIIQGDLQGTNRVGHLSSAYLMEGYLIHDRLTRPHYSEPYLSSDKAFCKTAREKDIELFITNKEVYGHLTLPPSHLDHWEFHPHNELLELHPQSNFFDWENRYTNVSYLNHIYLHPNAIQEPCPGVYAFEVVTERFAIEVLEELEQNGKWLPRSKSFLHQSDLQDTETSYVSINESSGTNLEDSALYQPWQMFLSVYIEPLTRVLFGTNIVRAPDQYELNALVIRQSSRFPAQRKEIDASEAVVMELALSKAGEDYVGGSYLFFGPDGVCEIKQIRRGSALLFRGKGFDYEVWQERELTKGTRFVLRSVLIEKEK